MKNATGLRIPLDLSYVGRHEGLFVLPHHDLRDGPPGRQSYNLWSSTTVIDAFSIAKSVFIRMSLVLSSKFPHRRADLSS